MIHHLSLPAENPAHVAGVLAEIFAGKATLIPGTDSWAAWSKDEYGTAIEVFSYGFKMQPGDSDEPVKMGGPVEPARYSETHAAVSVELSVDELLAIADRENWRAAEFNRGPFRVVEFWLENKVLIEFFTPEMRDEYTSAVTEFVRGEWS
jgi:hypothetical protein